MPLANIRLLLSVFDDALRSCLSILNINQSRDRWLQETLLVKNGGLGSRSSPLFCHPLHLLYTCYSPCYYAQSDKRKTSPSQIMRSDGCALSDAPKSVVELRNIQSVWDCLVASNHVNKNLLYGGVIRSWQSKTSIAAASQHSEDWRLAPPIPSVDVWRNDQSCRCSKTEVRSELAARM